MKFADFVCFEAVVPELKATDRNGVIRELIDSLCDCGKLTQNSGKEVARTVIKRENEASTGMGKGVAVPHVKYKGIDHAVATVGRCPAGIDFNALDKQPVHTVIALISPADNPDQHLKTMEKIFRHLQNEKFRKFLRQSTTKDEIEDLLLESDDNPELG